MSSEHNQPKPFGCLFKLQMNIEIGIKFEVKMMIKSVYFWYGYRENGKLT